MSMEIFIQEFEAKGKACTYPYELFHGEEDNCKCFFACAEPEYIILFCKKVSEKPAEPITTP